MVSALSSSIKKKLANHGLNGVSVIQRVPQSLDDNCGNTFAAPVPVRPKFECIRLTIAGEKPGQAVSIFSEKLSASSAARVLDVP